MIYNDISDLVAYGVKCGLVKPIDRVYTINRVLEILKLDDYEETAADENRPLCEILDSICTYAFEKGLMDGDSVVYRDLFDTKVMGALTPAGYHYS